MAKQVLSSLFERTVLIVEKSPEVRELIAGAFQNFRCRVILAGNEIDAFNLIDTRPEIDFVIVEVGNPISNGFPFLDRIRSLDDQRPPVFFIADKRDADFDRAFFLGCEAIFLKPLHFDELVKGVAFSYNMLVDHSARQHQRKRIRRVKTQFSNAQTGLDSVGYVTNVSAGGMYICSMYNHPTANQQIDFKLSFEGEEEKLIELSGRGVVRWLRPISEFGRPPGFGIEFTELSDEARGKMDAIIAASNV